jgi:hypothetical protein
VFIAQRAFASAVDLVVRAQTTLADLPSTAATRALGAAVQPRVVALITQLSAELERPALRRAAIRAAVEQLLRLGVEDSVCSLFLANRGGALRRDLRKLKMEGSTEMYVFKLARWFYGALRGVCTEFQELFAPRWLVVCVAWARTEVEHFAGVVARQVLRAASTGFAAVAECVHAMDEACAQLRDIGLDLVTASWEALRADLFAEITEHTRAWSAQLALDAAGEPWGPIAWDADQQAATAVALGKCGVVAAHDYIGGCRGLCLCGLAPYPPSMYIRTRPWATVSHDGAVFRRCV